MGQYIEYNGNKIELSDGPTLSDLVGQHELSGVEFGVGSFVDEYWEDNEKCQCVLFVLDSITYFACEDPDDGYRSQMRALQKTDVQIKNTFPSQSVFCKMKPDDDCEKNNVLEIYDAKTTKLVMTLGTENWDDYYPCFLFHFAPENMEINKTA